MLMSVSGNSVEGMGQLLLYGATTFLKGDTDGQIDGGTVGLVDDLSKACGGNVQFGIDGEL